MSQIAAPPAKAVCEEQKKGGLITLPAKKHKNGEDAQA
jgi:hypothetical protein